MNLKECQGRVPVFVGGDSPFKLVDFPTRKKFDELYKTSNEEFRDRYWDVLKMRTKGYSLTDVGKKYLLTRERIRQIEAKFLRKVATSLRTETL